MTDRRQAPPDRADAARGARAVFLDRDDTLLVDQGYMSDPGQVCLMPGVPAALTRLQQAGLTLVLISNQSGVARGLITVEQV
jgi:D-glycero-D-manno-heptose 1,7-bisphosphate phosphatase